MILRAAIINLFVLSALFALLVWYKGIHFAGGIIFLLLPVVIYVFPMRWLLRFLQTDKVRFFAHTNEPLIALTFDDGPDPEKTPEILDILDKYNARGSFFVTGENVQKYPKLTRQIVERGHLLCNHHWRDERTVSLSADDMLKGMRETDRLIRQHQKKVRFFRPGVGFYNDKLKEVAAKLGYTIVLGDVYPHDVMFDAIRGMVPLYVYLHAQPGSVIILHDKSHLDTGKTLTAVIKHLSARGYSFCTLNRLFEE